MQRKKICFVISMPGSARNFLKEPFKLLSKYYDIYLVANIEDSDDLSDMNLTGYKSIPIERRPNIKVDVKALGMLIKYFKEMKFDSVHSLTKKASLLTSIAGRLTRIPLRLHHFTGQMWVTMTGLRKLFYKYMDSFIVWSDTHMLVDGYPQLEFLENSGILKQGQGTVLGRGSICGIDVSRFSKNHEVRKQIRNELGCAENAVVFLFLARLRKEKGIYELFEAFNRVVTTCPNSKLLLVGTEEEDCISHIADYPNLKLDENVIYKGSTKFPEDMYNAADIYVLPTYREAFGLAILEASSTGLPVITTDTYGVRDSIVDNQTGLRCKTYDVDTLAQCMKYLYDNPDERQRLGENGINYVHENFTTEMVCGAWLDYYKQVVN